MTEADYQRLKLFNITLHRCLADPACNHTELVYHNITSVLDLNIPGDGSPVLRATIAVIYFAVSVVGLLGNAIVIYLLHSSRGAAKSTINFFVFNLAFTDLLFSAALLFWAVDTALDFSWPFGWGMCKVVSFLTSLNLYASVFFLTAMSVTRYYSVATALKPARPAGLRMCAVRSVTALIWSGAVLAAAPRAAFAIVADIGEDQACLLRYPSGTFWLGVHHLVRVVLGFLLPYAIMLLSYLLLLRFLCKHSPSGVNLRRRARVSTSVAVVVLTYCVCWFPNNLITFWGLLIQLDVLDWTSAYYFAHTYAFPLASCLAQTNGCLNPILYCLIRKEYRKALGSLLPRTSLSLLSKTCLSAVGYYNVKTREDQVAVPLNNMESLSAQSCTKRSALHSTTVNATLGQKTFSPVNDLN
ncbi:relaxin-3 receptor 1-like [Megalops cyprinoides]|uniref:relaxin-3 receptor 1-like n=1 Tax=Megalops cyprinoides TaxID=118141 RepID=UPI0018650EE8|nr:relaxin-3 receptor 1-like [Megalops cyprinoides]